jgi:hypothetical protein
MKRPSLWRTAGAAVILATAGSTLAVAAGPSHLAGEWRLDARRDHDRVQIELKHERTGENGRSSWSSSFGLGREELQGIAPEHWNAADAPVNASLVRDAGTFRLVGRLQRGQGRGTFTFEPDATFRAEFQRAGYVDLRDEQLARLALHDVGREWARGFESRGYLRLSVDDLIRLRVHDATPEFVDGMAAAGYRDIGVEDLVRLRVHAVDPAYARAMRALDSAPSSTDDLVRLKVHAVEPGLVRELAALGLESVSADQLVRLQVHAVTPEFVREMGAAGWRSLTPDELVRLRVHGVTPAFARRAREKFGEATVDELIRLRQHTGL